MTLNRINLQILQRAVNITGFAQLVSLDAADLKLLAQYACHSAEQAWLAIQKRHDKVVAYLQKGHQNMCMVKQHMAATDVGNC